MTMTTAELSKTIVDNMTFKPSLSKSIKIRNWYMKTFPTDSCGPYINPEATFDGLFETLDNYGDVYAYLGEGDSIIRERCFEQLAKLMECDYGYIYDQWLRGVRG